VVANIFGLRCYELTHVTPVTNDAPCRAGVGETAGLADCRAVHVPDGDRATVILQHEVGLAVAVEIASADDMPRGARVGDRAGLT
jgi:hypothetical protein